MARIVIDLNGPGHLDYKIPLALGASVVSSQTASVSFNPISDSEPADTPHSYSIVVELTTSDAQNLVTEVTVDVTDLLTGSATPAADYTFTEPAVITFPAGSPNLSTDTVDISILGLNQDDDIDLGLENVVAASIVNGNFTLNLFNVGA